MEYETVVIIHRKDKQICFFLKSGEVLSYDNILDVEVHNQPERSKREDKGEFVIKGSMECIALDAVPSKECREYHENSYIQINKDGKSYLMRCSEQSGN